MGRILTCVLFFLVFSISCDIADRTVFGYGVSGELAEMRAAMLHDISYDLHFSIPGDKDAAIPAEVTIGFILSSGRRPVILDFRNDSSYVRSVMLNGRPAEWDFRDGHLVVRGRKGANKLTVSFRAGDLSLNRNPDYLYTLLVPDRASTLFPCFDQPDLKAVYRLGLEIPVSWNACSNAVPESITTGDSRKYILFYRTEKIPAYLFAFVAGRFDVSERSAGGRAMRLYHRETDTARLNRNLDEIFNRHAASLQWLEAYTGIPYPFGKFDFVLIPSFQYGGMEHPGVIYYRESSLLLDQGAPQEQELRRAGLIAHETAHMWFGDLVTMRWFDDVWLKEVFANFMADKIVNPQFPGINHDLLFFLNHYPPAYEIDRSMAPNPVAQELDNLVSAGSLYGNIIYHKAPVAMRQLEELTGEKALQEGLREYLGTFAYGNATWNELIRILARHTPHDLDAWDKAWIKEGGMPAYHMNTTGNCLTIVRSDLQGRNRSWPQELSPGLCRDGNVTVLTPGSLENKEMLIDPDYDYILPDTGCMAYGYFSLDKKTTRYLLDSLASIGDDLTRGVCIVNLYEMMLHGELEAHELLSCLTSLLPTEANQQVLSLALGRISSIYWKFLPDRQGVSGMLEHVLWSEMNSRTQPAIRKLFFQTYTGIAVSADGKEKMHALWSGRLVPGGLVLSETDHTKLAQELALRGDTAILKAQLARITNPDRREEFIFVMPSLAQEKETRDSFFFSLADPSNREHEPWVLKAVGFLHHPLRSGASVGYLKPSLEWLEEIQATGDIFFPKRWLDASVSGHNGKEAAAVVREFLSANPGYPDRLRSKIIQSADLLFRSADMTDRRN